MQRYRVFCDTESAHVLTGYVSSVPTSCPNDGGHTIDEAKTVEMPTARPSPVRDIILAQSTKPYFDTNSSNYRTLAQFQFRGSDIEGMPIGVQAVVSTPNTSATANIRLIDEATGVVIAEKTAITFAQSTVLYIVALTVFPDNMPAGPAVLEVQAANPTDSQKIRVHSLILER